MTVIFAVSTRSYLWPGGASRSARAITPSASSSSSRPCRSSSASQPVQNPGPDAIRAAISAAPGSSSPRGPGRMDAGVMTMANLAVNKAPGRRKGDPPPRTYQELCSIYGTSDPVTPPRPARRQTVTMPQKPDTTVHKSGNFRAVGPGPVRQGAEQGPGRQGVPGRAPRRGVHLVRRRGPGKEPGLADRAAPGPGDREAVPVAVPGAGDGQPLVFLRVRRRFRPVPYQVLRLFPVHRPDLLQRP